MLEINVSRIFIITKEEAPLLAWLQIYTIFTYHGRDILYYISIMNLGNLNVFIQNIGFSSSSWLTK